MLKKEPIGEVIIKDLDAEKRNCTLSIHMNNASVKNRGYGTRLEKIELQKSAVMHSLHFTGMTKDNGRTVTYYEHTL